jgi:hypothetical protein
MQTAQKYAQNGSTEISQKTLTPKKTGRYKGTLAKKHGAFGNNLLRDNSQRMN